MSKAIYPRLTRRDEKLNEQLVPLFDPTGRLFLDVAGSDAEPTSTAPCSRLELDLKYGVRTDQRNPGQRSRRCAGAVGRRALAAVAVGPHGFRGPVDDGDAAHRQESQRKLDNQ